MNKIRMIAEMITDDPDVFMEDMTSSANSLGQSGANAPPPKPVAPPKPDDNKPLSSTELSTQAEKLTGTTAGASPVADQLKERQDLEQQQQVQRARVLDPQFKQVNSNLDDLTTGITQGQQAVTTNLNQFQNLQQDIDGLQQLLAGLQKTATV